MVDEKGLSPESAHQIGNYVSLHGRPGLVPDMTGDLLSVLCSRFTCSEIW